jgi:predicted transcriptional regulator
MKKNQKKSKVGRKPPAFSELAPERRREVIIQGLLQGYSQNQIGRNLGITQARVNQVATEPETIALLEAAKQRRAEAFQRRIDEHTEKTIDNWMRMAELADQLLLKSLETLVESGELPTEEIVEYERLGITTRQAIDRLLESGMMISEDNIMALQNKMVKSKVKKKTVKADPEYAAALWDRFRKYFFAQQKQATEEGA